VNPSRILHVCLAIIVTLVTAHNAALGAQGSGQVVGRVADQTGAPLPGVIVDLVSGATELTATTDLEGRYRFDAVPAGPAEVTFRLVNFGVQRRTVTVGGGPVTADATLSLSLNADVLVTAPGTFRNIADVANPAENLVGIASAASQGAITAAQLTVRPIMRAGEVLETVPGMIVSQHSGEGKANQYYLRGFNLDHGTDFSMSIAGVPVNTPTRAHAHGYADANFLIPELVGGVQFRKGPYWAEEGDFSAAGAASVSYLNVLDRPLFSVSGGSLGWGRALGAVSPRVGQGNLLLAGELTHNDGPWVMDENFRRVNTVVRYSRGDNRNGFSVTGLGYRADWRATDQVPQRAIDAQAISRFGFIDASDRGLAERQSVAADLQRTIGVSSLRASAFVLRNRLTLHQNFTYYLDDPVNGDQFEQSEQRLTVGGRVTLRRLGHFFERHTESAVGVQTRHDRLRPVGLYRTSRRARLSTTREDRVQQTMTGLFAQTEVEWTRAFRTTLGLRTDIYQYNVQSMEPLNSGSGADALVNPKFAAALGPWSGTELYVNAGMGFHSNDARGAAITIDPSTGEPADRVTPLVRARGAEVGLRTVRIRGLQSTVALWYLGLDSELLFVGDAGTTEAGRPSRRAGIEWSNYARPTSWMTLDADLSFSTASFTDEAPEGTRIPGSLQRVISGGLALEPRHPLFGSLRVRHFGPRPLIEDASVMSRSSTIWNGEAGVTLSPRAKLVLVGFNLFDARVSDIDYFYTSRLQDEPEDGVDDIHTHPAIPRSFRVTLQLSF
jgi:hypothetical protein